MAIKDIPGGSFFKPKDHEDAVAILFEVLDFKPDRPTKFGNKHTIIADVSVFSTGDDIASGTAQVFRNAFIENGPLVRTLRDDVGIGNGTVAKLVEVHFSKAGKNGLVLRPVDAATRGKVVAWAEARAAALEAAIAEAPED